MAVASTCDGGDRPLTVTWHEPGGAALPAAVRSLSIELSDPDANGFVHWLAVSATPGAGFTASGAGDWTEGTNSFGSAGYRGPCPPRGTTHRYVVTVTVYDTDVTTQLHSGFSAGDLGRAGTDHLIASAQTSATFGR